MRQFFKLESESNEQRHRLHPRGCHLIWKERGMLLHWLQNEGGKKVLITSMITGISNLKRSAITKEIQDGIDGKQYHLVLFHYPIFSWKNMGHGTILLYGHTRQHGGYVLSGVPEKNGGGGMQQTHL